ncbi:MAG: VCBS repeat-containing protein, partial [Phycisphaerales bacterium]|nr:VCBS repeat-containing protein [Phycisphaerales bacterium]
MNQRSNKSLWMLGASLALMGATHQGALGDDRATVEYYLDEQEWLAAVGNATSFEFTSSNVALADEVPAPPSDGQGLDTTILTFRGDNTGLPWDFTLNALNGPAYEWYFNTAAFGDYNHLNTGAEATSPDDDWAVMFAGASKVWAFGFDLIHNEQNPGEQLVVYGDSGELAAFVPPVTGVGRGFVGIVSSVPITSVMFDEDPDGDEIAIDRFQFGPESLFLPGGEPSVGTEPYGVAAGDLDGDGDVDLVVANGASGDISILLNWGDATFAAEVRYAAGAACNSVAIGDLDGDGDGDVVATNGHDNSVSVFFNEGYGTFAPQVVYLVGGWPQNVAIADLDDDDDNDLAVANILTDDVSILLNTGDGTFFEQVTYPAGDGARDVAAADLDGDNDIDLAVPNEQAQTVSILFGNGDGTFDPPVPYPAGDHPYAVAIADLDMDGDADLAVVNLDSNTVSIFFNDGNGEFSPQEVYETGVKPRAVALDDLDCDGDYDLAVVNSGSNDVSIWLNEGDGSFTMHRKYGAGDFPLSIASADLDSDGDNDLAVANHHDDTISILLNQTDPPCVGDLNGDGVVDQQDLGILLAYYGWGDGGDLDGDGDTDQS